jgi:hypothetical protein
MLISLATGLKAIRGSEKALEAIIHITMAIRAQKFPDLILFILKPPYDETVALLSSNQMNFSYWEVINPNYINLSIL